MFDLPAIGFADEIAHACQQLGLHDLALAAGVSSRAVQQAFKKHLGTTPMAYPRDQRLNSSRRELLASDPERSITDIALACGFMHPSCFARYYRERFDESPHDTLRRRL